MSRSTARTGGLRKLLAPAIAFVTAGILLLSGAAAAQAAPPYATTGTLDSVEFRKDAVESGLLTQLHATWSFPDRPATPAGFTIALPADLQGREEAFQLTATNDPSISIGTCQVTPTELQCELDPAYVAKHPLGLRGNVYFWVRVTTEVTKTTEVTYDIGGTDVTVTVNPPNPWVCPENCELNWDYAKDGWINYDTDRMVWYTHVKAPRGGMTGGQQVTVKDTPDAHQKLIIDDTHNPQLQRSNELGVNQNGVEVPVNWQIVPRGEYVVDADGTVRFTSEQGYYYQVRFMTERLADAPTYSNHVDFLISGVKDGEAETTAVVQKGGGTGQGTDAALGQFRAKKVLDGSDDAKALVPADAVFRLDYTYDAGVGFDAGSGSLDLPADGTVVTSGGLPVGAVLHFTEAAPAAVDGLVWGDVTYSPTELTIGTSTIVELTLTNAISVIAPPTSTPPVPPTSTATPTATTTVTTTTPTPTVSPNRTPTATPTLSVTGSGIDIGGSLLLVGLLVGAGVITVAAARTRRSARR